jgi:chemotaxis protein CheX
MAATISPINDQVIHDSIVRAVASVFKTMAGQEITFAGKSDTPEVLQPESPGQIIGSVGFAGEASGLIYLCLDEAFANNLTGRILGMTPAEVVEAGAEVVTDAIGEVTNMSVGGFKNSLCDLGHTCKLTLPTIVRGHHIKIASIKSAARHIFHFDCAGHRLTADIQMKQQ